MADPVSILETPPVPPPTALLCPVCHLPVQPEFYVWQRSHKEASVSLWLSEPDAKNVEDIFYFCPNCGKALKEKPLSVSGATQAWIYALSIVMPMIAFLAISHWPGMRYLRSGDKSAKQIGIIAAALMAASTIIVFWLAIVWTQNFIQSSLNSISGLGSGIY